MKLASLKTQFFMQVGQYFNPHRMANDVERVYRLVLGKTAVLASAN